MIASLREATVQQRLIIPAGKETDSTQSTQPIKTNWLLLWEDEKGNAYIDRESISYLPGNIIRVWFKATVTKKGRDEEIGLRKERGLPTKGLENWDHSLGLFEVNCLSRTGRLIENVDYDKKGNINWDPVAKWQGDEWRNKWQHIPPGTYIWDIYRYLCQ